MLKYLHLYLIKDKLCIGTDKCFFLNDVINENYFSTQILYKYIQRWQKH